MFILNYDPTGRGMGDEKEVARFSTQEALWDAIELCMDAEGRSEQDEMDEPHWIIDDTEILDQE